MHRKSADHLNMLKVTWYIIRLKTIWSTKNLKGGGDGVQWAQGVSLYHKKLWLLHFPADLPHPVININQNNG